MTIRHALTAQERAEIYAAANAAVWRSHQQTFAIHGSSPREDQFVAAMVTVGVDQLVTGWQDLLAQRGIALRITGVFCHGSPQVEYTGGPLPLKGVELADLLVVHQSHGSGGRTRTTAKLVQAKMSSHCSLPATDRQLFLYKHWPVFEFSATSGLDRRPRNLGRVSGGCGYALILHHREYPEDIRWADQCPWGSCLPAQRLGIANSFANTLGDMLFMRDGRACSIDNPRGEWSRTVRDLLQQSGARPSSVVSSFGGSHRSHSRHVNPNASIADPTRTTLVTADSMTVGPSDSVAGPPISLEQHYPSGGDRGLSVIMISTEFDATASEGQGA